MKNRSWLDWLVYLVGSAYVMLFLFSAGLRLMYPYEVEWNEGAVLDHAIRIATGRPMYAAPSLDFTAFVYTPFYYYATALVMKIGGVGLWSGRVISILATLLTAMIAGRIVHRETSSSLLAFTSMALYIAFYHLTGFFYDIVRMDALAICLVAGSIYASLYLRRGYLIAAVLVALAYFAKQQMIFALPALLLGLAFRSRKHAAWFGILSVGLIVFGSIIYNSATAGWYGFYTTTIPGMKAAESFSWQAAFEFFPTWIVSTMGLFTLVLLVAIIIIGEKNLRGIWPVLWSMTLMALISSALSIGNFGGYKNVYMPLTMMLAIVFPIGIKVIADALPEWLRLAHFLILLGFLSLVYNPLGEKMLFASLRQRQAGDEFIEKLKAIPGDVWIPFHGYIGTLAGKPMHVHYMAMNDALVPHDSTSMSFQRQIDSALTTHRFSAIILDEQSVYRWDSVSHYVQTSSVFKTPNVFLSRIGDASTRPDHIFLPTP
jgi:hypothetical protein